MNIEEEIDCMLNDPRHQRMVYVFAEDESGPCKIGMSTNPNQRLKEIRAVTKMKALKIWWVVKHDNASSLENAAHANLHSAKIDIGHGKEWFAVSVDEAICAINKALSRTTVLRDFWKKNPHFVDGTYVRPPPVRHRGENHWARRAARGLGPR